MYGGGLNLWFSLSFSHRLVSCLQHEICLFAYLCCDFFYVGFDATLLFLLNFAIFLGDVLLVWYENEMTVLWFDLFWLLL